MIEVPVIVLRIDNIGPEYRYSYTEGRSVPTGRYAASAMINYVRADSPYTGMGSGRQPVATGFSGATVDGVIIDAVRAANRMDCPIYIFKVSGQVPEGELRDFCEHHRVPMPRVSVAELAPAPLV
jgi:hypothetical protein